MRNQGSTRAEKGFLMCDVLDKQAAERQATAERIGQLEAVIREQELTIQRESSARALAVARLKTAQKLLRQRKAAHA